MVFAGTRHCSHCTSFEGTDDFTRCSNARVFVKFDVDTPLTVAISAPLYQDLKLANIRVLLEKDPYFVAVQERKEVDSAASLPEALLSTLLTGYKVPKGTPSLDAILSNTCDLHARPLILPA